MWPWLRKTARRGLTGEPWIFFRIRSRIRCRMSSLVLILISSSTGVPSGPGPEASPCSLLRGSRGSRLARLLLQDLAHVADPLLPVRVGLAAAADLRRHLPHLLPVDPGDGDPGLLVPRDRDPLGDKQTRVTVSG